MFGTMQHQKNKIEGIFAIVTSIRSVESKEYERE